MIIGEMYTIDYHFRKTSYYFFVSDLHLKNLNESRPKEALIMLCVRICYNTVTGQINPNH